MLGPVMEVAGSSNRDTTKTTCVGRRTIGIVNFTLRSTKIMKKSRQ